MQTAQKTVFEVFIRNTGKVVGTYSTFKRASTACDRKDGDDHDVREVPVCEDNFDHIVTSLS